MRPAATVPLSTTRPWWLQRYPFHVFVFLSRGPKVALSYGPQDYRCNHTCWSRRTPPYSRAVGGGDGAPATAQSQVRSPMTPMVFTRAPAKRLTASAPCASSPSPRACVLALRLARVRVPLGRRSQRPDSGRSLASLARSGSMSAKPSITRGAVVSSPAAAVAARAPDGTAVWLSACNRRHASPR